MMRGRNTVVALLIVALLATGVIRALVHQRHDKLVHGDTRRAENRMAGLNSFALGLILGGLRGPLVMVLWTSSENQKTAKDLEDFDTKIELIRMLQPEFDSVHIFQIWNKGYNIVAQMSSLPNKYSTILDAIRYGRDIDAQRPDNVNILVSIGDLYLNKLGNSAEKRYFIPRIREDTMHRQERARPAVGKPMRHEVLLDDKGYILPQFINPPAGQAHRAFGGGELAYLAKWNTAAEGGFDYGVSPIAIGYAYYRRASEIASKTGRRHMYLGESVLDSRGPVALKFWADEEIERARRGEARALGLTPPDDRLQLERTTAAIKPGAGFVDGSEKTGAMVREALFSYRRGASVARQAAAEHRAHIENPAYIASADYRSHMHDAEALAIHAQADHDYLSAMGALAKLPGMPEAEKAPELLASAAEKYREARKLFYLQMLRYYIEDDVAMTVYPQITGDKNASKVNIEKVDPALYPKIFQATREFIAKANRWDMHKDDSEEYTSYIERIEARLGAMQGAGGSVAVR